LGIPESKGWPVTPVIEPGLDGPTFFLEKLETGKNAFLNRFKGRHVTIDAEPLTAPGDFLDFLYSFLYISGSLNNKTHNNHGSISHE